MDLQLLFIVSHRTEQVVSLVKEGGFCFQSCDCKFFNKMSGAFKFSSSHSVILQLLTS